MDRLEWKLTMKAASFGADVSVKFGLIHKLAARCRDQYRILLFV